MARPRLGKQTVTGNLVADPVKRPVDSQSGFITTFRLAENHRVFDKAAQEWTAGEPTYYDVAVKAAKLGDNIRASVGEGHRVTVTGNYEPVPYITKNGEAGLNNRIWADEVSASLAYASVEVQPNPKVGPASWDDPSLGRDVAPATIPAPPTVPPAMSPLDAPVYDR